MIKFTLKCVVIVGYCCTLCVFSSLFLMFGLMFLIKNKQFLIVCLMFVLIFNVVFFCKDLVSYSQYNMPLVFCLSSYFLSFNEKTQSNSDFKLLCHKLCTSSYSCLTHVCLKFILGLLFVLTVPQDVLHILSIYVGICY